MAEQTGNPTALSTIVHRGLLTQERAAEIVRTFWPKAPESEVLKAAILCESYGLNPLMKHVFLIPFKDEWALVMGISATRLIAQQQGDFSYIDDTPRIMDAAEQTRILGKVDPNNIVAICKLKNVKTGATAVGYGNWPVNKAPQGTEKGNTAANMAFIRAERQALGRLCPGKLPENIEVVDETTVDLPKPAAPQVIEGTVQELPGAAPPPVATDFTPDTEMCPIHNVESRRNKYGGFSHKLDGNGPKGTARWCNWNKPKETEKPTEGEISEQPTDDSGKQALDAPAASAKEIDRAGDDGPCRKDIESLAQQLWGPEWEKRLRNWLKDNYQYASRKDIKEDKVPDIVKKLTAMVEVK